MPRQRTITEIRKYKRMINVPFSKFTNILGERTGLVVRASDSGSGDPGSILDRVGVLIP